MTPLLSAINQPLCEQGLYIKSGEVSIVDASVVEVKQSRPNKGKDGRHTQYQTRFIDAAGKLNCV